MSTLASAMRTHCCDDVVCVVNMSSGRGASPLAMPFVAGFVVQFRLRFSRIAVVEARGLAKSATQTVIALSRESKIKTYRTWDEFDAHCQRSDDPRDKLAQRVVERSKRPQLRLAPMYEQVRERWQSFVSSRTWRN